MTAVPGEAVGCLSDAGEMMVEEGVLVPMLEMKSGSGQRGWHILRLGRLRRKR